MNSAVLTMDDISSKNTPAIVDYLCEKQITAVMFAVGANVERLYDEAIYALKKGMIVGNHSYSHPFFSKLSWEDCVEEIEHTEEILNKLYADAGVKRQYRPFRFPYFDRGGEHQERLQEYLKEREFDKLEDKQITYGWYRESGFPQAVDTFTTFDFAEYQIRPGSSFTKESVFERMEDKHPSSGDVLFGEDQRHILILHAHDETDEQVPGYYKLFLDYVMEKGLVFEKPQFRKLK